MNVREKYRWVAAHKITMMIWHGNPFRILLVVDGS
jgi:hypothetical protein